jgi:hypothetical protein
MAGFTAYPQSNKCAPVTGDTPLPKGMQISQAAAVVMLRDICSTLRQAARAVIAQDICSAIMNTSKNGTQHLPLRMELGFTILFVVDQVMFGIPEACQC